MCYRYTVYDEEETLVFESGKLKEIADYIGITLPSLYSEMSRNQKIKNRYSVERYEEISDAEYETFIHGGILA